MKFIVGFIVALIAVACAALMIMYTGSYNVAADAPDNPVVNWYLSNTMIHSVISRAKSVQAPPYHRGDPCRRAALCRRVN